MASLLRSGRLIQNNVSSATRLLSLTGVRKWGKAPIVCVRDTSHAIQFRR